MTRRSVGAIGVAAAALLLVWGVAPAGAAGNATASTTQVSTAATLAAADHRAPAAHFPQGRPNLPASLRSRYGALRPLSSLPRPLPATPPAPAASAIHTVFTVDTTVDSPPAAGAGTSCTDSETVPRCSLRAAIAASDADAGHLDEVSIPSRMHLALSDGPLDLSNSMLVSGTGATVDGQGAQVLVDSAAGDVEIAGLEITGGSADEGGGVDCTSGSLVLKNVTISGNHATEGAGVFTSAGCDLWLEASTVSANTATNEGGGLAINGAAYVTGSLIGGTDLAEGNGASFGGGILADGSLVMVDSQVSWNSPGLVTPTGARTRASSYACGTGAGIVNNGSLDIEHSLIVHNLAPAGAEGVGIDNDGQAQIDYTSISYNVDSNSTVSGCLDAGSGIADAGYGSSLVHDTFVDNEMVSSVDHTSYGTAIYSDSRTFNLADSTVAGTVTRLSAPGSFLSGGAIALAGPYATLDDVTVTGTTADAGDGTLEGGAVVASPAVLTDVSIEKTNAVANTVYGGAIFDNNGLTIADSSISSTSARALSYATTAQPYSCWGATLQGAALMSENGLATRGLTIIATSATTGLAPGIKLSASTCIFGGVVWVDAASQSQLTVTGSTVAALSGDGSVDGGVLQTNEQGAMEQVQVLDSTVEADDVVEGGLLDAASSLAATDLTLGDATVRVIGSPASTLVPEGVTGSVFATFGVGFNVQPGFFVDLVNGTFAGVRSSVPAAAAANDFLSIEAGDSAQLLNDTVGDDTASGPSGTGALLEAQSGGQFTLENSIVDGSASLAGCAARAGILSSGHNIDSGRSCGFANPGDLSDVNPKLLPLGDYGGTLETAALTPAFHEPFEPGSPAIGAADGLACPPVDARGVLRPHGRPCDIGAYEVQAQGYALSGLDGGVFHFGAGRYLGSVHALRQSGAIGPLGGPIVAAAATADLGGYLQGGSDGGMFAFGDGKFRGSLARVPLAAPIVGMATDATGLGYWEVGANGHVYPFGDATYHGSEDYDVLHAPVAAMASTHDGLGYWLVTAGGGVIPVGDAHGYGSPAAAGMRLTRPLVGMATTPDGHGYWLVASDGGVFAYGDATYHGSTGGERLNKPIVAIVSTPDGLGYWLVASDGGVFNFGDADFDGSMAGHALSAPIGAAFGQTDQG